jgi:UrcA family protein
LRPINEADRPIGHVKHGSASLSRDRRTRNGIAGMKISRILIAGTLSAMATLTVGCGAAAAQSQDQGGADGILVEAPRKLALPVERNEYSGAPEVVVTLKISVLYGDLDLANPANAARLMTRVDRVAHDACRSLDRLYPLSPDASCVDHARARAMPAANAAILAARK